MGVVYQMYSCKLKAVTPYLRLLMNHFTYTHTHLYTPVPTPTYMYMYM